MSRYLPPSPMEFFSNLRKEHGFVEAKVVGQIPSEMNGVLYRNGAGLFEMFGRRCKHTFEADGAISALEIKNSRAYVASEIIKTKGLLEESRQGKNLYGSRAAWPIRFSNRIRGRDKNNANTHVITWQGRLFALMEGGKATELEPETLKVIGEVDFQGAVTGTFSAHPHYIVKRKALYNFGMSYGKDVTLNCYELPDLGPVRKIGALVLEKPVMLHDFITTENHLLFFVSPMCLSIPKVMLAIGSFADAFEWRPELGSEIIIVPIDDPQKISRFKTDPFMVTHFGGAFEVGNKVYADYIRYEDNKLFENLGDGSEISWEKNDKHTHGVLHRAEIDLDKLTFKSKPRWSGYCEFPRIMDGAMGRKYSNLWLQSEEYVNNIFRASISKINENDHVKKYLLEEGQLCSEPVPVPSPVSNQEEAGYIITLVFDSRTNKSHYLILTAKDLEFQARIQLDQTIPITFHGSWVSAI